MVTLLKGSGLMIRQTVMVFILTLMELNMKDTGKMIYSMEKVKKFGLMALSMRENI